MLLCWHFEKIRLFKKRTLNKLSINVPGRTYAFREHPRTPFLICWMNTCTCMCKMHISALALIRCWKEFDQSKRSVSNWTQHWEICARLALRVWRCPLHSFTVRLVHLSLWRQRRRAVVPSREVMSYLTRLIDSADCEVFRDTAWDASL